MPYHFSHTRATRARRRSPGLFFQPKLTVNAPGDQHEQEADRVADQVMRMRSNEEPIAQRMPLTPVNGVQRKCTECEEKEKVQRAETGSGKTGGQSAPPIVSRVLSSGSGRPMDAGTRQFMENRFGQDFGQVRIHTGSQAAESAVAIQAKAYTSGRDIVFGAGEYRPDSSEGRRLLAHELAHVGQQGEASLPQIQKKDAVVPAVAPPAPAPKYTRCSEARSEIIEAARQRAIDYVQVTIRALTAEPKANTKYGRALLRHFVLGTPTPGVVGIMFDTMMRMLIQTNFRNILTELHRRRNFRCDFANADCSGTTQAFWDPADDLIHICQPFFSNSFGLTCRAIILIHECAHDVGVDAAPGPHTPNRGEAAYPTGNVPAPAGQTAVGRINVPDAYAFFAAHIWRDTDTGRSCF